MTPRPLITLLTDFGLEDCYVGILKGVILGINPEISLVDLTHEVPPQDITAGAFLLQSVYAYFPRGTIHLAVVDPGVGTGRLAIALRCREQLWVGPDNGLFHLITAGQPDLQAVRLENPAYFLPEISATFQGRDILAPAAAHLSRGLALEALGPPLPTLTPLAWPQPELSGRAISGQVIYVDHFGNLISNLPFSRIEADLERQFSLRVGQALIRRMVRTYGEAKAGDLIALAGSHGYLEIACVQGHAARLAAANRGTPISIAFP